MKNLLYLLLLLPFVATAATKISAVEHSSTSVIVNVDLYDGTDPSDCPAADLTHGTQDLNITVFDDVTNGQVDFFECTGAACVTTDTIEDITTLGTYATPTANNVRFKVLKAGSCWYQLQFENSIYSTASANRLDIEITAPGIIAANFWIDLTPISSANFIDNFLSTDCSTYSTPDEVGYQLCTLINAIHTDTDVTLDAKLNAIDENTSSLIMLNGVADSGTTTTIVDAENLTQADHYYSTKGAAVIVQFSGGSEARCIRQQTLSTNTIGVTPAFSQAVGTESFKIVESTSCRNFP
jgi:hypothetical protein